MHRQTLVARIALLFAGVFGVSALLAPDATALPTLPFGTPTYTVQVNRPGGAPGYIFYTSGLAAAVPFTVGGPGLDQFGQANIIVDKSGKEVWRYVPPKGQSVSNFRTPSGSMTSRSSRSSSSVGGGVVSQSGATASSSSAWTRV